MQQYTETFSNAVQNVMSQFGITDIKIVDNEFNYKNESFPDVNIHFSITGDVHGTVTYSMNEPLAKEIASVMMGMGISDFDDIAKSAVCELGNMLAANSCTDLASFGLHSDISTPHFFDSSEKEQFKDDDVLCVELKHNDLPFYLSLSLS